MSIGVPASSYAFTPQAYGFAGGIPSPAGGLSPTGPGIGTGPGMPGLFAQAGGLPAFGAYEVPTAITAPALLAAVAMRRGQPLGPTNDHEMEEFLYDALDLLPGTNDVEVRCDAGRVTLTGMVQHKRLKRDVGEIAWATPGVNDVVNNVNIAARRRPRAAGREAEPQPAATGRKQA
jgi:BON domain